MTHCAPCISELTCTKVEVSSIDTIVIFAADYFDVPVVDLRGKSQKLPITEKRQMIMVYLWRRGFTQTSVAKYFHRDHTTLCWAAKQVNNLSKVDSRYRDTYTKLVNFLNGL